MVLTEGFLFLAMTNNLHPSVLVCHCEAVKTAAAISQNHTGVHRDTLYAIHLGYFIGTGVPKRPFKCITGTALITSYILLIT